MSEYGTETMDRKIEDNRWIKPKHYKFIGGGALVVFIILVFTFRDNRSTYRTERNKVSIETVTRGAFQDYIRIVGIVEPISIVYLDAVEGGMVEDIIIEEGTMVEAGDIILRLSNTNLSLSILSSEAQLAEKANFLRETELNMQQQKLAVQRDLLNQNYDLIKRKRVYDRNLTLFNDDLISKEEYLLSKEDYQLTRQMLDLTRERQRQDSAYRKNQVEKIQQNLDNMQRNLELIYKRQDNLNIKAPVTGQLGFLNAELGQSIATGQRIGQVNVLTSYKVKAEIDEHYIDRVRKGLFATFHRQADTFQLQIAKVYPEVRDGRFEVDLTFTGQMPDNIRTGQSYHISLELGETQQALLVSRGSFFQSTGGQWIFVLSDDGAEAYRREIRIGKQNPQHYEVLEGLEPGEKVITSGYDVFGDNERLVFK